MLTATLKDAAAKRRRKKKKRVEGPRDSSSDLSPLDLLDLGGEAAGEDGGGEGGGLTSPETQSLFGSQDDAEKRFQ